jgi:iron complex transport system permease protein
MARPHPLAERGLPLLAGLLLLALAALGLALTVGSAEIPVARIWTLLWAPDGSVEASILHELRLPRALTAFAVGGLLAVAGALMQVLLRNPLGDPYVLGVSGGAAAAVLAVMLLGWSAAWHAPAAFGGALFSMLLVFALGRAGRWQTSRLLLTGVVVAAGWSALISFVLSLSPPVRLPGMLFWLMGDLGDADRPLLPGLVLLVGLGIGLALARDLNVTVLGEARAMSLGVRIGRLHVAVYFLASLLTAAAVTVAGAIGFIGLITPHMVRLAGGGDHRVLLPGAALLGGALLTTADTAARTVVAPQQLPVGVLTALIGVPVFLVLLARLHRGGAEARA